MISDQLVDEYLDAVAPAWCAMDFLTFAETIDVFLYDPLIALEWTELHTLPMLDTVAVKRLDSRTVAQLLHDSPSVIRCLMHYDILMAKCARLGTAAYLRIFDFYQDVLQALCKEDVFAKRFRNIIHAAEQVRGMVGRLRPSSPTVARALGRLANACYNLSYGLYSDMNPQLVYDNLGPYVRPDGRLFVLKIFHNLKPVELWPETASLPVGAIDVGVQLEGVTLKVDAATHAIYEGDQVNGLRGWWCEADGKALPLEAIDDVRQRLEATAVAVYEQVKQFNFEKKKEFYCFQKAWGYKKLYDVLDLDWRPPPAVLAAARGKSLFTNWNIPEDKKQAVTLLCQVFDPRREVPAEAFKGETD
ncbi:MAG: hypothetical protein UX68_C0010G0015 [Parcubacteria group bacterium GW2011_GWA2_46_9]|nr:MAG: hypothetical protein UX68_C0010G0015 [Parcubacteria group bacterium GW2011_GWA2_46_9]